MPEPLVSCLCCTYGRPTLLGEAVKCFIDQDYPNKELIILNDQEGVEIKIDNCPNGISIWNYGKRFESLGEKRNAIKSKAKGEYICIWDDDDLYTPWRISESIEEMQKNDIYDIIKGDYALMSINNANYKIVSNLFHSQACITKKYMDSHAYPFKSVGEDIEFEKGGRVGSISINPLFWYVYRWGLKIHHLSGIADEKKSWERSLTFDPYNEVHGNVIVEPKFQRDYWSDIEKFLKGVDKSIWQRKIKEITV